MPLGRGFLDQRLVPQVTDKPANNKANPSQNKLITFKKFKTQRQPHINFTMLHVLMTHLHAPMSWNRFGFR